MQLTEQYFYAYERFSKKDLKPTVHEVVSSGIVTPDGMALDWIHNNLYWTDTGTDKIEVINLKSNRRKTLLDSDLDQPRAIVLDLRTRYVYFFR